MGNEAVDEPRCAGLGKMLGNFKGLHKVKLPAKAKSVREIRRLESAFCYEELPRST